MSEILDLKNHVTALSSKINHIVDMVRNSFAVNDKMNELLSLMHQIGLTNQNKNDDIFGCILPDLVKRVATVEELIHKKTKILGKGDHIDFQVGTGKSKRKIHMFINEDSVHFYGPTKNVKVEL